jgi:ribosomal-protein-alanine N-acetyltransferase
MALDYLRPVLAIERACFKDPWPPSAFLSEIQFTWSWFRLAGEAGPDGRLARVDAFLIGWVMPDDMHVLNVAVAPEARRRGLARRLLLEALEGFAERGGGLASLEVRPSNVAARRLYEALGFRKAGLRKNYYRGDHEDALVMNLEVAPAISPGQRRLEGR